MRPDHKQASGQREALVEVQQIGSILKATALDPDSLVEVTVQGPLAAGEAGMTRLAVQKLQYRLNKLTESGSRSISRC